MGVPQAIVGGIGLLQYQQQGAIGKYNQAVANRNAQVAEQEAALIEKQSEFDIARFDKNFRKIEGTTRVALAKSGVVAGSGTAYKIAASNAREAELQRQIITYNSKVAQSRKIESANFARIQGNIARQSARLAQIGTLASTGTSLLGMSNFGSQAQSSVYSQANFNFASSR
tara:strand:+ start:45 stop:557 length:513 start_codon:yes stop_codon:yes gene_type:complete